jgi:hypothetical protein
VCFEAVGVRRRPVALGLRVASRRRNADDRLDLEADSPSEPVA